MRSDAGARPVAIVGGGFSGTMTAVQLARRGVGSVLIDGGQMHRGVAYSTVDPAHLLNVPSGKMSVWPDRPGDFAEWLGDDGTRFAERRAFGRYVAETAAPYAEQVERRAIGAVGARREGESWLIELADGAHIAAAAVVLANGNQPPPPLADGLPGDLFVNNPWSEKAREAVARVAAGGGDVLILGTGLTMIDTLLSLAAAGHRGQVVALSRRGLLPLPHGPHQPVAASREELPAGALLPLWRWLRRRSAEVGFRAAVDSLRPHSRALWQALPVAEQRRFLRHARPWWDVHRHRIAPEVGLELDRHVAEGRLEVVAGRLCALDAGGGSVLASFTQRGGAQPVQRRFAAVFNCTGPLGELGLARDPLLQQLFRDELVRLDELGLGLVVDERSRAAPRTWALGPLTRGCFWEITAVPDIRVQAEAVAEDIVGELGR